MKQFIGFIVLSSAAAFASARPAPRVTPDMYSCEGKDTTFNYTTTSFVGTPTVSVKMDGHELSINEREAIKVEQTRIGQLVSVSDMRMVPVDGPEVRYTLVVPHIELGGVGKPEEFESMVIRTSVANPFFRPRPFAGAIEHNQYVPVKCTAEFVLF